LEVQARSLADEQDESAVGQTIGHCQVISVLGVGGMGEVYLAKDTQLGRKIALKLLPAAFTRDKINPLAGRNRTPTTYNLDLGAFYPIKLGESRQLRIQLDWFNVFNDQREIRPDETLRTNSGIPAAEFIQFPNPFYGQGTIFQFPSSLRLGIKFQF
jgi:serine/threonine protein kinase